MYKKITYIIVSLFALFSCINNINASTVMAVDCGTINDENALLTINGYIVSATSDKNNSGKYFAYTTNMSSRQMLNFQLLTASEKKMFGVWDLTNSLNSWINTDSDNLYIECPNICIFMSGTNLVCTGTEKANSIYYLDSDIFTVFKNDKGEIGTMVYNINGEYYGYLNNKLYNTFEYQQTVISAHPLSYWKIDESSTIYYQSYGLFNLNKFYSPFSDLKEVKEEFPVIFNSKSKLSTLTNQIDNWMTANGIRATNNKGDFSEQHSDLIRQCKTINNEVSNFGAIESNDVILSYNYGDIYNQLNNSLSDLNLTFSTNKDTVDFVNDSYSYAITNLLGSGLEDAVGDYTKTAIKRTIKLYLESKGVYDITSESEDYSELLYNCTNNIKNSAGVLKLNDTLINNYNKLNSNYGNLLRSRGINIVENCEDLLGEELIARINKYMNYVKIIVPILVILLGMLDFGKAVLASNEDEMKKAQKAFVKRLLIAVAIFFIPIVINIILNIVNIGWGSINGGTCGIN